MAGRIAHIMIKGKKGKFRTIANLRLQYGKKVGTFKILTKSQQAKWNKLQKKVGRKNLYLHFG